MRAGLLVLLVLLLPGGAGAAQWGTATAEVRQLLGEAVPQAEGLRLESPDWQEDGAFVPLTLHLRGAQPPLRLSLLRSGEDEPRIAHLELSAWHEPLELSTRVRLPRSQQLLVVARDGAGRVWLAATSVAVAGSSCLATPTLDPLNGLGRINAQAGLLALEGGTALALRTLLRHPMESGRRLDATGQLLPKRLLRRFEVRGSRGLLLRVEPFEGLAANPYWRVLLPQETGPLALRGEDAEGSLYQRSLMPTAGLE